MKITLIVLIALTTFSLGYYSGAKALNNEAIKVINQLDTENQNLQYQLKQCMILYRGQ